MNQSTRILMATIFCSLIIASLTLALLHTHDDDNEQGVGSCVACAALWQMRRMISLIASVGVMLSTLFPDLSKRRIAQTVKLPARSLISLKVRLNP